MDPLYALFISQVTKNQQFAIYTAFVWDWLLCLKHEVELVSIPGPSPAKLAYLWCRYFPLLTFPLSMWIETSITDHDLCQKLFRVPVSLAIVNFSGAAAVLTVRLYAFTGQRIIVPLALLLCFLVVAAYQIWVVATQLAPAPHSSGCSPAERYPQNHFGSGYFLSPFLFDLIATTVFLVFAARIKLPYANINGAVKVFIREGIVYFIAISAVNLGNTIMVLQPNVILSGLLATMSLLMPNLLACRLVINLRSMSEDHTAISRVSGNRSTTLAFVRTPTGFPSDLEFSGISSSTMRSTKAGVA